MDETPEQTAANPVTVQELAEAITELEEYRERLVNETMETAKKAKLMKPTVMARLEPELSRIDSALQQLRQQQAELASSN